MDILFLLLPSCSRGRLIRSFCSLALLSDFYTHTVASHHDLISIPLPIRRVSHITCLTFTVIYRNHRIFSYSSHSFSPLIHCAEHNIPFILGTRTSPRAQLRPSRTHCIPPFSTRQYSSSSALSTSHTCNTYKWLLHRYRIRVGRDVNLFDWRADIHTDVKTSLLNFVFTSQLFLHKKWPKKQS